MNNDYDDTVFTPEWITRKRRPTLRDLSDVAIPVKFVGVTMVIGSEKRIEGNWVIHDPERLFGDLYPKTDMGCCSLRRFLYLVSLVGKVRCNKSSPFSLLNTDVTKRILSRISFF